MSAAAFICAFAVNAFWQSSLLVSAAWIALRIFRSTNATTRYAVWLGALAASLALPLTTTVARIPRAAVPQPVLSASGVLEANADVSAVQGFVARPGIGVSAATDSASRYRLPAIAGMAIAWAWSLIAGALLLRLALSLLHLERLKRDALPLAPQRREGLFNWNRADRSTRGVRLCLSDRARVPTAIGLFDAMILIPKDLEHELDAGDLDRIVLHELAHLRRRDDWTNALAQAIQAMLFFSPAVVFAVTQLDLEREVACDDAVLLDAAETFTYANTLARMAEIVAWPHRPLAAPGIFMTRRGISIRIERILEDGRDVRTRLAAGPAALALGAIAVISVTGAFAPSIALSPTESPAVTASPIDDASPAEILYSGTWELTYGTGSASGIDSKGLIYQDGDGGALLFGLHYPAGLSNWTAPADLAALGIGAQRLRAATRPISFLVLREAGTFSCSGEAGGGVGHGEFRFQPDAAYVAELASLGVKLSLRDQVVAGMGDVSVNYVRGIAELAMTPMSFQTLITLKMMGGSLNRVRALKRDFPSANAQAMTALIMMMRKRLGDVRPLHELFPNATIEDVTTMGLAGVTPDYVAALQSARVQGLSAANVTALRSAGVDKAFVERMVAASKTGLTVDQVAALKSGGF